MAAPRIDRKPHALSRRAILTIVASLTGALPRLHAQERAIPSGRNPAQIIAAARAEGASYPRIPARDSKPAPRTCVAASGIGTVTSGEFTVGGNVSASAGLVAGRPANVWWAPLRNYAAMPPLVVRARDLTTMIDTLRFAASAVAPPRMPGQPRDAALPNQYFFPSAFTLPAAGRWLVIATSEASWGCFILNAR